MPGLRGGFFRLHAFIESVGAYIPDRVMTNDELSKMVDTSNEWILSHTGIRERHLASDNERASDLACRAAERALESSSRPAEEIDLILLATSTPDFAGFPSTASIVQEKIGAKNAGAMDLSAACTGFIYGLETARAFVESGSAQTVLVIGAEVLSRIVDWSDRNTCVLFGDGAGAVVVSRAADHGPSRIAHGFLKSQGSGAEYLYVDSVIRMNGRKVYTFAVKALCDIVDDLLHDVPQGRSKIRFVVPHQANIRIITAAGRRMGLPEKLFYTNMDRYANTSAASIPIALNEIVNNHLLSRGDLILTIGFGGGLTYGGNLIYW